MNGVASPLSSRCRSISRVRTACCLLACLAIAVVAGCGRSTPSADAAGAEDKSDGNHAIEVRAAPAELRTIKETVVGYGRCEALPERTASLTAAVEGQVVALVAKLGDRVKQNQPIVQLDVRLAQANLAEKTATREGLKASLRLLQAPPRTEDLKAQESAIEQAKLALEKAQATVDRLRPLLEKQQIPPAQFYEAESAATQAKLQREAAEAQLSAMKLGPRAEAVAEAQSHIYAADAALDTAQLQLDLCTLKSPIEGVLDGLTCRLGQTLAPGSAVGEVVDARQLRIVVWLAARQCARIKVGQHAEIMCDSASDLAALKGDDDDDDEQTAADTLLSGKIVFVGHVADSQTGSLPVHILVDNSEGRLAVGQVVSANITVNEKAGVLAVPLAAIADVGEGNLLNVIRNGKSQRAQPDLGIRDKAWVEISGTDLKEPLKAGELVVVEGGYNLPDGTAVSTKSGAADETESNHESSAEEAARPAMPSAAAPGDPK